LLHAIEHIVQFAYSRRRNCAKTASGS
jgi:hypothetical protein